MERGGAGSVAVHLGALGDLVLAAPALELLRARTGAVTLVAAGEPGRLLLRAGVVDALLDAGAAALAPLFAGRPPDALRAAAEPGSVAVRFAAPGEAERQAPLLAGLRAIGLRAACVPSRPAPDQAAHAADVQRAGVARALDALGARRADGLGAPEFAGASAMQPARASAAPRRAPAFEAATPRLTAPPRALDAARAALDRLGLVPGGFVALHPGSGGQWKCWPADRFLALATRLRGGGLEPLLLLGPVEREARPEFEAAARAARLPLLLAPPLERLLATLALARAYAGNDSGVTHLAAAAGAPTLALFGATDPAQWAPRGPRTRVIDARPDLGRLSIDAVHAALLSLTPPA